VKALRVAHPTTVLLLIVLAVIAVSGCGGGGESVNAGSMPTLPPEDAGTAAADRAAKIYAAVIRQLVTKDHTFGRADPGFKVVYVLDGVVEDAEDPSKPVDAQDPTHPFSHDLKGGVQILSRLGDLPPIRFVPERDPVVAGIRSGSSPGHVKNGGVLISLGPIEGNATRVRVGNSLWISGLAGQWLTYVLEQRDGDWTVRGTSGPMAIS
jgi:hypothetical protein